MNTNLLNHACIGLLVMAVQSASTYAAQESSERVAVAAEARSSGSTIPGIINDHIPLGTAYDSQRNIFLNVQPVSGSEVLTGNTSLKFDTAIDMDYEEVLSALNGKVDLDVNFPVVRVSAGASLAKEMAASTYSSSYTFAANARPEKRVLQPTDTNIGYTLSPLGQEVAQNHQGKIQDLVGDEFVTSIEYGASLLVNLKIDYGSNRDKSDIGGYLDVDLYGGVFNVGGQLQYLEEETKSSVKITVRAVQQGGDPKQLLAVIPNNIISCSLEDPKPCFDMFYEAVKYAKESFGAQLNTLDDYNVRQYETTRYDSSSLVLKQLVPEYQVIRHATKWLISDLEDDFQQALIDENRASQLLTSYFAYLPEAQRTAVTQIKDAANENAWFYFTAARHCRDNPFGTSCEDYYNQMKQDCTNRGMTCPAVYDISQLQLPQTNEINWKQCEFARQEAVRSGAVPESESIAYRFMRWAPTFIDNDRPAVGILNWRNCEGALTTYGDHFNH